MDRGWGSLQSITVEQGVALYHASGGNTQGTSSFVFADLTKYSNFFFMQVNFVTKKSKKHHFVDQTFVSAVFSRLGSPLGDIVI